VFENLSLSSFLSPFSPFFVSSFILILPFLPRSSPNGAATATGTTATDVAVGATPVPAPDGEPRTPEGVPEDVVEFEGEPEVAPEPVLVVEQEEAPAEGAMIVVRAAVAPPPSHGARAPLSSAPSRAAASGAATSERIPPLTRRATSLWVKP
jgi:hypothetical protein